MIRETDVGVLTLYSRFFHHDCGTSVQWVSGSTPNTGSTSYAIPASQQTNICTNDCLLVRSLFTSLYFHSSVCISK